MAFCLAFIVYWIVYYDSNWLLSKAFLVQESDSPRRTSRNDDAMKNKCTDENFFLRKHH